RQPERVIAVLLEALKDKNPNLRRLSATLLAQMKPIPASAAPALRELLQDPDLNLRINVAVSLCGLPEQAQEAIPVLVGVLKTPKQRTQAAQAVEALAQLGPQAKEAVPVLLAALQDEGIDFAYADRIGWALEQIAGPEVVETLRQAFAKAS